MLIVTLSASALGRGRTVIMAAGLLPPVIFSDGGDWCQITAPRPTNSLPRQMIHYRAGTGDESAPTSSCIQQAGGGSRRRVRWEPIEYPWTMPVLTGHRLGYLCHQQMISGLQNTLYKRAPS